MKKIIIITIILSLLTISYFNYISYKSLDTLFSKVYYPIANEQVSHDKKSILDFIEKKDFILSYKEQTNTYTLRHKNNNKIKNHNLISIKFDKDDLYKIYFLDYDSTTYFSFYSKDYEYSPYKIEYSPISSIDSMDIDSAKSQRNYLINYVDPKRNHLINSLNKIYFFNMFF